MPKKNHRLLHHIIAALFVIIVFVHAIRIANNLPVSIGTWSAPMWLSWIAILVLGSLAVWLWSSE